MAKFNLKQAQKSVPQAENRLIQHNEDMNTQSIDDSGNYQYRLKDEHKDPQGDSPYQKMMENSRDENSGEEVTEAAMNRKDKTINDMDVRSDKMSNTPLMDYAKKITEDKKDNTVPKSKRDTEFWDTVIGPDKEDGFDRTKIIRNKQRSQLISNYDNRDKFEKENKTAQSYDNWNTDAASSDLQMQEDAFENKEDTGSYLEYESDNGEAEEHVKVADAIEYFAKKVFKENDPSEAIKILEGFVEAVSPEECKDTVFYIKYIKPYTTEEFRSAIGRWSEMAKNTVKDLMRNIYASARAIQFIKDADAMLYSIYRKAAKEGRKELTNREKDMINSINSSKIRILSGQVPK